MTPMPAASSNDRLRIVLMIVMLALPGGVIAALAGLVAVALVRRMRRTVQQLRARNA